MSLIVIHADDDIVPAAQSFRKDAVRRDGADGVDAFGFCRLNGRFDLLDFLGAEKAVFSAVGVESGDSHLRIFNSHIPAGLIRDLDDLEDAGFFYPVAGFPQGNMGGNVNDSQIMVRQHHGVFFRIRIGGVNFRMAVEMGITVGVFPMMKFQSLVHGFFI